MDLRPYQTEAIENLRMSLKHGARSPCLVLPTGAGKTILAKSIIESAVARGRKVLFLAPRRELIYQTAEKLEDSHYGIIMAGERRDMFAPIQVACIPTLHRRIRGAHPPVADVVIIDEAHLSISDSTQAVLKALPDAVKIGLTATPARTDGRGLGEVYDDLVMGPSVKELTQMGYLVPTEYYAPTTMDLHGVKTLAGDYNQKQLGEVADQPKLIGDVVTNWARIAPDRQTVVFGVNVAHAIHLRDAFRDAGFAAEHINGKTPNDERKEILQRVYAGEVQIITNCDVLSYGWDCPPISCAVLARPTKSVARYLQAGGRILRPYGGKETAIIIDHTGVVKKIGCLHDRFSWTLDGVVSVKESRQAKDNAEAKEPKAITCSNCSMIFEKSSICPNCGHNMVRERAEALEAVEADLGKVDTKTKDAKKREWSLEAKRQFFAELKAIGLERGYKHGWAANFYRKRLGVWPSFQREAVAPSTPSAETKSWVTSQMIRYAKGRRAA